MKQKKVRQNATTNITVQLSGAKKYLLLSFCLWVHCTKPFAAISRSDIPLPKIDLGQMQVFPQKQRSGRGFTAPKPSQLFQVTILRQNDLQ